MSLSYRSILIVAIGGLAGSAFAGITFHSTIGDFDAVSTTSLVEDFESITPTDTAIIPSFSSNGVTYLSVSPATNVWVTGKDYTNFGVPLVPASNAVLTATGIEKFELIFDTPTTAVGFDTYLNYDNPATVKVFGSSGLITTYSHNHDSTTIGFLGITSTTPIHSVLWETLQGNVVNTGIDNVRLGVAIPEPSSLLFGLTGLAIGALALRRRR